MTRSAWPWASTTRARCPSIATSISLAIPTTPSLTTSSSRPSRGSFLNHQWLIAAATPTFAGAPANLHALVDTNGFPNTYPLYIPSDPHADPLVSSYPRCPNNLFQYHHQPFNYYAAYGPGTPGRTHLRDEQEFLHLANASTKDCKLNAVSFVKPTGQENEHPGYASEPNGSSHLVDLLQAIENSSCRKDTMVVVTYDEFGGQWDHVSPPGQGAAGPHDQWGPGTRIPAVIISPHLRGNFVVDHTQYDTTSILATIEHRYGLLALGGRDAAVNDLSGVIRAKSPSRRATRH